MTQSRLSSFIEVCIGTFIGFVGSYALGRLLYWYFDKQVSGIENFWFTVAFTVWSLVRGYYLRRYFNKRLHQFAIKLAGE